jgi:hypothetical protein
LAPQGFLPGRQRPGVGEIKENADRPDSRGVGVELVATFVTTSDDGGEDRDPDAAPRMTVGI